MLDALKTFDAPVKKTIGYVVAAVVLIWFWHPIMKFIVDLATKADGVFK